MRTPYICTINTRHLKSGLFFRLSAQMCVSYLVAAAAAAVECPKGDPFASLGFAYSTSRFFELNK